MKVAEHAVPFAETPGSELSPASMGGALIGRLLIQAGRLTEAQVERALEYGRAKRIRFGEAAVRLRLVAPVDVLEALSKQFHYPYAGRPAGSFGNGELVAATNPFGNQAEAFRALRDELMEVLPGEEHRALAVVSPGAGDGKTYVAANLAVSFAQLGARTALMDADMRRPRQHRLFGVDCTVGLSTALAGRSDRFVVQPVAELPGLYLLPAGPVPPNPLELLQSSAFQSLIEDMLERFDRVVLDTPAAERGADGRIIAGAGAALVIARKHQSSIAALQKLVASLSRRPVKIAGVLMNEH
jgi:chain length determinant protein tyrosine kinase EpsG